VVLAVAGLVEVASVAEAVVADLVLAAAVTLAAVARLVAGSQQRNALKISNYV
jgi:hypothetical protein